MSRRCTQPLDLGVLIAYDRGELADDELARVEEHYFACADCTRALELVGLLGAGVARLVESGNAAAGVPASFVERMQAAGLTLRTYRLSPGERVACTAAPDDDFVIVRLDLGLIDEADTVEVSATGYHPGAGTTSTLVRSDVVVDRDTGELIYLHPADQIRALPRTLWTMEARVRGPRGERRLGPFTLDHTPWDERRDV